MIKIVFITTGLSTGGAEGMLLKLMEHIDRQRFEPEVISLTTLGEVGPSIAKLGILVRGVGMTPGRLQPLKLLRLAKILYDAKSDIVQTWMYHADLIGGLAAKLAGCKRIIWSLRNSNLSVKMTKRSTLKVVRACAHLSSWLPSKIISCSASASAVHVQVGYREDKIKVIPNGFDLVRFRRDNDSKNSVRQEMGLPKDALLVGLMARYDPQKNHAGFIKAAAIIWQSIPNVHFILAGNGIDETNSSLKTLINRHGLSGSVHLLGRRDDMPRLMSALDVLASPSHGEAFPNVLGEAMACGVPCVVTDVGDSAEIVGNSGRVVQPGDMGGLAQHILEILQLTSEERVTLGLQVRAMISAQYEIKMIARTYEAFYEQMMVSVA